MMRAGIEARPAHCARKTSTSTSNYTDRHYSTGLPQVAYTLYFYRPVAVIYIPT